MSIDSEIYSIMCMYEVSVCEWTLLQVFKVSDLFETKPKKAKPAAPVIQNMSVQNPEHAIMGLRHFTETPAPPPGRSDPHPHYHSQSKGYHNSHFTEDDYDDGYYTGGSRQRNGGPQKYPGNDINTERPLSTQVYYIDASENAERERKPTFSKMTTQLWSCLNKCCWFFEFTCFVLW